MFRTQQEEERQVYFTVLHFVSVAVYLFILSLQRFSFLYLGRLTPCTLFVTWHRFWFRNKFGLREIQSNSISVILKRSYNASLICLQTERSVNLGDGLKGARLMWKLKLIPLYRCMHVAFWPFVDAELNKTDFRFCCGGYKWRLPCCVFPAKFAILFVFSVQNGVRCWHLVPFLVNLTFLTTCSNSET